MQRRYSFVFCYFSLIVSLSTQSQAGQAPTYSDRTGYTCTNCIFSQAEDGGAGIGPFGGGIAWIDYNNDGLPDIFIPNISTDESRLFRNLGPVGVNGEVVFAVVDAGVDQLGKKSAGVAVGDYDGDGFDDLFVASAGNAKNNTGKNALLRNLGDGRFEDVTDDVGLNIETKGSYVASFGDIDRDGDLDLYVGNWRLVIGGFCPGENNDLYLNKLDESGGFERVDMSAVYLNEASCTFAVAFSDHNLDGKLDLFVVNDDVTGVPDQEHALSRLFLNGGNNTNGTPSLFDVSSTSAINAYDNSDGNGVIDHTFQGMGIAIGDYDNDGDLDYHRTSIGPGPLSENTSSGWFLTSFSTREFGDLGDTTAAWGTVFLDPDNDGWLDLFVVNTPFNLPPPRKNRFYLNAGGINNTYLSDTSIAGIMDSEHANGVAVADYDNDGDIDVVTHKSTGEVALYRNDTVTSNSSLYVKLRGAGPNLKGIGAIIRVTTKTPGGQLITIQMREVHAGSSHGSAHEVAQLFGLGSGAVVDNIEVTWPTGCVQSIPDVTLSEIEVLETECQSPATYAITGAVTSGDPAQPVVNAHIRVQNATNGATIGTSRTDGNGQYTFVGAPDGASYAVTASKAGFSSQIRLVSIFGTDGVRNLSIAESGYIISGTVRSALDGAPLAGATVNLAPNAGSGQTTTTDAKGTYVFNGLDATFHSVTASLVGYVLSPGPKIRQIQDENLVVNFLATAN